MSATALNPDILVGVVEKNARERVHVTLSLWKGRNWLHVRVFVPGLVGDFVPTPQGICIDVSKLTELRLALEAAEREAIPDGQISLTLQRLARAPGADDAMGTARSRRRRGLEAMGEQRSRTSAGRYRHARDLRPARRNNETPYDADYRALAELHDFVGQVPGLAVLVLQHNRKAESDDPIDLISGTLGGPGVADTLLVLAKSNQGTTLYVRGRDVEERDLAVRFNKQTCRWSLMGDASDVHLSETRRKILDALHADKADSRSPKEIALATGLQKNVVDQRLPRHDRKRPSRKAHRWNLRASRESPHRDPSILRKFHKNLCFH